MEFNIDKMTYKLSCFGELNSLKYFKQFNVYQNIQLPNINSKLCNIENTIPTVDICSANITKAQIIDTMKGTSLEGQNLSGKKLVIVGNISMSLILTYVSNTKRNKKSQTKNNVVNIRIPFSTYIVIPNNICESSKVNLRYLIEDISIANITQNKILISTTMLVQYLDEY